MATPICHVPVPITMTWSYSNINNSAATVPCLFLFPFSILLPSRPSADWYLSFIPFFCFNHAGRSSGIFMLSKRSSGLDFSDGKYAIDPLQQHPDMATAYNAGPQPSHLQRNKSERTRLQGLQRSNTVGSNAGQALNHSRTFRQKFGIWMINEGGRQLFFGIWVFLHLLVAVFGMFHYQLKDNLVTARATFGITFCTSQSTWVWRVWTIINPLFCSDRPRCSSGLARRCHLYPSPCLPQLHFVPSPDPS